MTLRDDLLSVVNDLRQLPDDFGMRRVSVVIRKRKWAGGTPGAVGAVAVADVELTPRPRVDHPSPRLVASSGGTYEEGDYLVKGITPAYTAPTSGGYTPGALVLTPASDEDVVLILTGDDGAHECILVAAHFDKAFRYELHARPIRAPVRG